MHYQQLKCMNALTLNVVGGLLVLSESEIKGDMLNDVFGMEIINAWMNWNQNGLDY